jgi:hypothetical protein
MSANQDELPPNSHEYSAKGFREYMITINAVAFIAVGLRFYSRGLGDRRRARFWWDDWVALASVVSRDIWGLCIPHLGSGPHFC